MLSPDAIIKALLDLLKQWELQGHHTVSLGQGHKVKGRFVWLWATLPVGRAIGAESVTWLSSIEQTFNTNVQALNMESLSGLDRGSFHAFELGRTTDINLWKEKVVFTW